jgi:DDE superfamily endonuclease
LIIGHANKPRTFKKKSGEELGFFYLSNTKAWMTSVFFENYLRRFNRHIQRKVLLLIDNAPSHAFKHLKDELSNIEILPLPPHTTSKLQPLDAGVIVAFKRHYRKRQLSHALNSMEAGKHPYKVDQLTAMRWIKNAWQDLDVSTLVNCWRHTTLLDSPGSMTTLISSTSVESSNSPIDDELIELINTLSPSENRMTIDAFLHPEEETLTDIVLTDEELPEAAQDVEVDAEQEETADMMPLHELFSKEERVKAFSVVLSVLEGSENLDHEETRRVLLRLKCAQSKIRDDIRVEHELRRHQPPITTFFRRTSS